MPTVHHDNMPTVDLNKRRLAIKTTFHDPDFLACFPSQCALIEIGLQIQLRQQIREIPPPHTLLLCLSFLMPVPLQLWLVSGSFCFVGQALQTICQRHNALHFGRFGHKQTSIEHTTANSCSSIGLYPSTLHPSTPAP